VKTIENPQALLKINKKSMSSKEGKKKNYVCS
jgi:hypothetical protein